MTRVPYATREKMDAHGQEIWDDIETSRGGVARNYAALLNNPDASAAMIGLGTYARYNTPLDPRIKALAVLTAAREACGKYVWTVNQPAAKAAGFHEALRPDSQISKQVLLRYGDQIIQKSTKNNQVINRKALAQIIFKNNVEKNWLEKTIHPFVNKRI